MKKISILFFVALFAISCNEVANKELAEKTAQMEKEAGDSFESFGKEISADGAIASSELITKLENQDSVFVKINTTVLSVCKKKGCWMMVSLDDKTEMRVKFKDYDFFVPLNSEDRNVIMEGWAFKEETSAATLRHYAADANATDEEIDAITEPEIEYTFLADGVLMN